MQAVVPAALSSLFAASHWSPLTVALIAATILFAAFLRGFTGFGFGIAAVPLLALFMPPARAVPLVLWLQLFGGIVDLRMLLAHSDWRSLRWLTAGAVLGTPLGTLCLHLISPDAARLAIALVSGLAVAMLASGLRLSRTPGRPATALIGLAAGVSNGLAAMPSPPVIAYYMALPFEHRVVRASLIMFFTLTSVIALGGIAAIGAVDPADILVSACLLPVMWAGTRLGGLALARGGLHLHRGVSMTALALIAVATGWKGLQGLGLL